jgi:hypothetical protein
MHRYTELNGSSKTRSRAFKDMEVLTLCGVGDPCPTQAQELDRVRPYFPSIHYIHSFIHPWYQSDTMTVYVYIPIIYLYMIYRSD